MTKEEFVLISVSSLNIKPSFLVKISNLEKERRSDIKTCSTDRTFIKETLYRTKYLENELQKLVPDFFLTLTKTSPRLFFLFFFLFMKTRHFERGLSKKPLKS